MFEGIIGNDKIKQELINSVNSNKCSHSYLFVGTSGIGKKLIAREFAKMILCETDEKYCNKCKSCLEFNSGNNPDFNYSFVRCLLRTPLVEDTGHFNDIIWDDPEAEIQGKKHFVKVDEDNLDYDFHLDSLSTAIGLGCYR